MMQCLDYLNTQSSNITYAGSTEQLCQATESKMISTGLVLSMDTIAPILGSLSPSLSPTKMIGSSTLVPTQFSTMGQSALYPGRSSSLPAETSNPSQSSEQTVAPLNSSKPHTPQGTDDKVLNGLPKIPSNPPKTTHKKPQDYAIPVTIAFGGLAFIITVCAATYGRSTKSQWWTFLQARRPGQAHYNEIYILSDCSEGDLSKADRQVVRGGVSFISDSSGGSAPPVLDSPELSYLSSEECGSVSSSDGNIHRAMRGLRQVGQTAQLIVNESGEVIVTPCSIEELNHARRRGRVNEVAKSPLEGDQSIANSRYGTDPLRQVKRRLHQNSCFFKAFGVGLDSSASESDCPNDGLALTNRTKNEKPWTRSATSVISAEEASSSTTGRSISTDIRRKFREFDATITKGFADLRARLADSDYSESDAENAATDKDDASQKSAPIMHGPSDEDSETTCPTSRKSSFDHHGDSKEGTSAKLPLGGSEVYNKERHVTWKRDDTYNDEVPIANTIPCFDQPESSYFLTGFEPQCIPVTNEDLPSCRIDSSGADCIAAQKSFLIQEERIKQLADENKIDGEDDVEILIPGSAKETKGDDIHDNENSAHGFINVETEDNKEDDGPEEVIDLPPQEDIEEETDAEGFETHFPPMPVRMKPSHLPSFEQQPKVDLSERRLTSSSKVKQDREVQLKIDSSEGSSPMVISNVDPDRNVVQQYYNSNNNNARLGKIGSSGSRTRTESACNSLEKRPANISSLVEIVDLTSVLSEDEEEQEKKSRRRNVVHP